MKDFKELAVHSCPQDLRFNPQSGSTVQRNMQMQGFPSGLPPKDNEGYSSASIAINADCNLVLFPCIYSLLSQDENFALGTGGSAHIVIKGSCIHLARTCSIHLIGSAQAQAETHQA